MLVRRQITFLLCLTACGVLACAVADEVWAQEPNGRLDRKVASTAVDVFKKALDERWSYRHANNANIDAAILALRNRIDRNEGGILEHELGIELQKILALGIDGHARVSGFSIPAGGRLPFLIEVAGKRYVAIDSQRKSFLADGFPFLTKIDNRSIDDWCDAVLAAVMKGSPQVIIHLT
jgi:hypothetical protein